MRKVDEIIGKAFKNAESVVCSNTSVQVTERFVTVFLYGYKIARRNLKTGKVFYSTCGFNTNLTANRLRACGCDCVMKNGKIIMQ